MSYPTITINQAQAKMKSWSKGDFTEELEAKWAGFGESVEPQLDLLLNRLINLTAEIGEGHVHFDSRARPIVHEVLSEIDQDVLLVPDFWRYVSSVKCAQIVAYRHGVPDLEVADGKNRIPGQWDNYGACKSSVRESLIYRLYVGASLGFDPANSEDPYHLCRIEDVDLWQSHIIRVLTGENTAYVRALLIWFRDRESWYESFSETRLSGEQKTFHIRQIAKGVRRLRSNVLHEFLGESEIRQVIELEAEKTLAAAQVHIPKAKSKRSEA